MWISSCGVHLKLNQKALRSPCSRYTTVAPVGAFSLHFGIVSLQLGGKCSLPAASVYLLALWMLACRGGASSSVLAWFMSSNYKDMASSATVSYYVVLVGNQQQWQWSVLFRRSRGSPSPTTYRELSHFWHWGFYVINLPPLRAALFTMHSTSVQSV